MVTFAPAGALRTASRPSGMPSRTGPIVIGSFALTWMSLSQVLKPVWLS